MMPDAGVSHGLLAPVYCAVNVRSVGKVGKPAELPSS